MQLNYIQNHLSMSHTFIYRWGGYLWITSEPTRDASFEALCVVMTTR